MEVFNRITRKSQTMTQEDFDVLKSTGHAKNFDVVSESDYEPQELSQELTMPDKPTAKPTANNKVEKHETKA